MYVCKGRPAVNKYLPASPNTRSFNSDMTMEHPAASLVYKRYPAVSPWWKRRCCIFSNAHLCIAIGLAPYTALYTYFWTRTEDNDVPARSFRMLLCRRSCATLLPSRQNNGYHAEVAHLPLEIEPSMHIFSLQNVLLCAGSSPTPHTELSACTAIHDSASILDEPQQLLLLVLHLV